MFFFRSALLSITLFYSLLAGDAAIAQVPTHIPGTVCLTPSFWCWAQPPGPAGNVCYCPSPDGWVRGRLG